MSTITVRPDQFEKAMQDLLKKYGDETYEISMTEAKSAARNATKSLKASAPTGGSYARGWSHKAQKDGYSSYSETVYNRTDYQLTHLLEKPHATGKYKGGKYPTNVDYTGTIARVEEVQGTEFVQGVLSKL